MGDESVSWEAGTIIYKFGEKSHYAYLLKKGAVEIFSENGTKVGFVNKDDANDVFKLGSHKVVAKFSTLITSFTRNGTPCSGEVFVDDETGDVDEGGAISTTEL